MTGYNWSWTVLLVLRDQWTVDRTGTVTSRTGTKGPVLSVTVRFSLGLFSVLVTGPLSTSHDPYFTKIQSRWTIFCTVDGCKSISKNSLDCLHNCHKLGGVSWLNVICVTYCEDKTSWSAEDRPHSTEGADQIPVSSLLNNPDDSIESVEKEISTSLSHLERMLSVGYGNSSQGNPTEIRVREQKEPGFNL